MLEHLFLIVVSIVALLFGGLFVAMREKDRQNQNKIREMGEQLRQASKMESAARMAGGVAHDFNNMLSGICGAAECLKAKLSKKEDLKKYCDVILSGCEQASHLAKQMTKLYVQNEKKSATDLLACLNDSLDLLAHGLEKNIKIVKKFECKNLTVNVSSENLQSLILNLGFNARDAMGAKGKITVGLRKVAPSDRDLLSAKEFVEISFADTGTGIAPENMKRIFEPFFTTKKEGKGNGLGLAEAYALVRNAGGTIRAENLKKGACFYVTLPVVKKERKSDLREKKYKKFNLKILLVEDDVLQRELAREILSKLGCDVKLADSVSAAFDMSGKKFCPDVVMSDVCLSDGSGSDVYMKLKKKYKRCGFIFLSGREPDGRIMEILQQDERAVFLDKPCRVEQVAEKLQFLLAKA